MDTRISKALAAATVVALPLLAACSGGSSGAAPSTSAAPAGSAAPASQAGTPSTTPSASTPSPTSDPAADKKDVQAATEKFVKTALTIGYPQKTYDEYTAKIKPLMTKHGFSAFQQAVPEAKGSEATKTLYEQRARSVPSLRSDVAVSSLTAAAARAKVSYRNRIERQSGAGWKAVRTSTTDSITLRLVKDGGKWLVDDPG